MSNFLLELVTPEELRISKPVEMVVVPGVEGDFGVLAGHMNFISTLRPGIIEIYDTANAKPTKLFVAGGIAEVGADHCTVLVEEVLDMTAITRPAAEMRLEKAIAALELGDPEHAGFSKLARERIVANVMLELAAS